MKLATMLLAGALFAAMPASSNYSLHNYGYGSGGTSNSSSTNYRLNGISGETSGVQSTSTNYKVRSGNNNVQQSNVPTITLTNTSSFYDKLKFVVGNSSNPSDTKFVIAISTDNFTTTKYIQADDTIGNSQVFQTYALWGGASGQFVTGLQPSTTYYVKVAAMQGSFTETEFGPSVSAATVAPSITFDIDVAPTDQSTNPPYATSFGNLLPATVTNSTDKIWVSLATNGDSGAKVYVKSANSGMRSNTANFTISSATADLSSATTGFGAQGSSATQKSGGPLSISAPYNVAAQNVGILDSAIREIFSASAPITGGRGSFQLKAKAAATTPAQSDYSDTLTLTAVGIF
jgi:hypothetical protein